MRNKLGLILILGVLLLSCKNVTSGEDKKDITSEIKSVDPAKSDTASLAVINKPVHLSKNDFLEKVMDYEKNPTQWVYKGELPCLIDFYADWCAPCRLTAPILEDLAKEYAGKITIYKIDVQKEQELANIFQIQGIPAFLYCPQEGSPSMTSGIGQSLEDTKNMFRQNIENYLLKSTGSNL